MNTKLIARKSGKSVAEVNDVARDLHLMDKYSSENRCWYVSERNGLMLIEFLSD